MHTNIIFHLRKSICNRKNRTFDSNREHDTFDVVISSCSSYHMESKMKKPYDKKDTDGP